MSQHPLIARLQPIFREVLAPDLVLTEDLDASKVPEWDSLNHISLVVAIESEFGVELSAEELATLLNVGDMARLLATKIGSNS
jgi:acyl carrier protein